MTRTRRVSDTSLVRRSQQGDRRAFRALLGRYDWRLHGLAHALLLDPGRVDAVLRVAYIRAWREVVRIDAKDDASAWLYRVAYNACIDVLRRESARAGTAPPNGVTATGPDRAFVTPDARTDEPVDVGAAADVPAADAPAADGRANADDPGAPNAAGRHAPQQLIEALTSLAPADRVAVVLVDREGFAPTAAARILGLTDHVLETRLAGARARLARQAGLALTAASLPSSTVVAGKGDDGDGEQDEEDGEQREDDVEIRLDDPDATVDHDGAGNADEPGADDTPAEAGAEEPDSSTVAAQVVASRSANGTRGNGEKPSKGAS